MLGEGTASGRYRGLIPMREFQKIGFCPTDKWLLIGKHGWSWDNETRGFDRVAFDVCDDKFDHEFFGPHYRQCVYDADLVTCNSLEMQRVIKEKTGRDSTVIPDPYEQPEGQARVHDHLLWFGHQLNFCEIEPYIGILPNLHILSNEPGYAQWSPETMNKAFADAGLVVIPTGRSMAKSGNRAIESIRRGLFVIAGYLPAYGDLGIYTGNIEDGVEWALTHKHEVIQRIRHSQQYVKREYSPERIAQLWVKAINGA